MAHAVLAKVDARDATARALDHLHEQGLSFADCHVFAMGKAAAGMVRAALPWRPAGGIAVVPETEDLEALRVALAPLEVWPGGHPWPREDAPTTARRLMDRARGLDSGALALCLISGGGSAMFEWPAPGVSLGELRETTELLMGEGLDLRALNACRARLSRVKAGGLARALAPASVVTLVLSDVGDLPPWWVASGPTLAPPGGALPPPDLHELRRRGIWARLPEAARRALRRSPEPTPVVRGPAWTVADGVSAQRALAQALRARGLRVRERRLPVAGEARVAGLELWEECRVVTLMGDVDAVAFRGETTVRVRGPGRGGRNQELVLAAVPEYRGGLCLSFGTDGIDGRSSNAGAFLDPSVMRRVHELGLDPARAHRDSDSASFFERAAGVLVTGPTGTNVADVGCYVCPACASALASSA